MGLGLEGRVVLPGFLNREKTAQYFRHCLFFVLPSRYEPFGIVNLEAMASQKAVIAAAVGGVAEVVEEAETGLLVHPEDPTALSRALASLIEDPAKAGAMGKNGFARVKARYTWPDISRQYLEIYTRL